MFKPVEQKSVVESVREQIRALILEGDLTPGSKLPPEKELIRQLNVSRPALREALHRMIGEGLLEVHPGRGTYVREPSTETAIQADMVSLLLQSESLDDIQEVRRILEPEIAALAAERATDAELGQLDAILDEIEADINAGRSIFELSWTLHRRLANFTGNGAMAKIVEILYEMIRMLERPLYDQHFEPWQELRGHRDLVQAITTRDADRARAAMRAHMASTDQCLTIALAAEQPTETAE